MGVNDQFYQLISKLEGSGQRSAVSRQRLLFLCLLLVAWLLLTARAQAQTTVPYTVQIGDTWQALAMRHNVLAELLHNLNPSINPLREPIIGATVYLPESAARTGRIERVTTAPILHHLAHGVPYTPSADLPLHGAPLLLPSAEPIREFPQHVETM